MAFRHTCLKRLVKLMAKVLLKKPILLTDSAEKQGWTFTENDTFAASIVANLQDGDYSINLLPENYLYCDRKNGFGELSSNLFSKADRDRFKDCLERTRIYKYKFIIVEENLNDIYFSIALKKMHIKADALLAKIIEISLEYNISFVFAGKLAKMYTLSLLKKIGRASCRERV